MIAGPAFAVLSFIDSKDVSKRPLLARMQGLTYLSKLLDDPPADSSSANLSGTGAGLVVSAPGTLQNHDSCIVLYEL